MVKTSSKQKLPTTSQNTSENTQRHFKGVRIRKWGKWVSEVRMPNSTARIWLGSYDSPRQAARAYDCAVYCLRGRNAKFNFPDLLPEIPSASSLSPAQIKAVAARFAREESPLEKDTTFCGSETQSRIERQQSSEEQRQDWTLLDLDSLLQELDDTQCLSLNGFPSVNLDDIDFHFAVENEGGLFHPKTN